MNTVTDIYGIYTNNNHDMLVAELLMYATADRPPIPKAEWRHRSITNAMLLADMLQASDTGHKLYTYHYFDTLSEAVSFCLADDEVIRAGGEIVIRDSLIAYPHIVALKAMTMVHERVDAAYPAEYTDVCTIRDKIIHSGWGSWYIVFERDIVVCAPPKEIKIVNSKLRAEW